MKTAFSVFFIFCFLFLSACGQQNIGFSNGKISFNYPPNFSIKVDQSATDVLFKKSENYTTKNNIKVLLQQGDDLEIAYIMFWDKAGTGWSLAVKKDKVTFEELKIIAETITIKEISSQSPTPSPTFLNDFSYEAGKTCELFGGKVVFREKNGWDCIFETGKKCDIINFFRKNCEDESLNGWRETSSEEFLKNPIICKALTGESPGEDRCNDSTFRKNIVSSFNKIKEQGFLSGKEWEEFNPFKLSCGFKNLALVKSGNSFLYFARGATYCGDAPGLPGGHYNLAAFKFIDDKFFVADSYFPDFIYSNIFDEKTQKELLKRVETIIEQKNCKEEGKKRKMGDILCEEEERAKIGPQIEEQMKKAIEGKIIEGFFTKEEMKKIINVINDFKKKLEL